MADLMVDGELVMYGIVGADASWGEEGFAARGVLDALAEKAGEDITVRLNSGGGYVNDAVAIYSAFRAYSGKVTVTVDAIAASAASLLAMGADHIVMRQGAVMMIHNPAALTIGTWTDHEQAAAWLKKEARRTAEIYAARTGKDEEECLVMMDAETWLTADEAVEARLADATDKKKAKAFAKFDYGAYRSAPPAVMRQAITRTRAAMPPAVPDLSTWRPAGPIMSTVKNGGPVAETTGTTPAAPEVDVEAIRREARAEGAKANSARGLAIMSHVEATGREELARSLAFETELSVEAAVSLLTKAAKATTSAAGQTGFAAVMAKAGNPDVGADTGAPTDQEAKAEADRRAAHMAHEKRLATAWRQKPAAH